MEEIPIYPSTNSWNPYSDSLGILILTPRSKSHCLALAIANKTLDENRLKHAQMTTNCSPPNFKVGDRVYFKNKQPGKWDLKWRTGYRIVCKECNGHYLHIENQATEKTRPCNVKDIVHEPPVKLWKVDTIFGTAGKFTNHPANLPTFPLNAD